MTEHRDNTVAEALRRLDVPDHRPGFWHDVEARLSQTAPAAGAAAEPLVDAPDDGADPEPDVVDLRRHGQRPGRFAGGPRWWLVAAALVLVALLAGVSLLRPGGEEDSVVDVADQPGDGGVPGPTDGDDAPSRAPDESAATKVADAWLSALAAGEVDAAYELLVASSRDALPRSEFRDVSTGLAEGAGAFAAPDVERRAFALDGSGAPPAWVVVYSGEVEREGMVETSSYPVVVVPSPEDPRSLRVSFSLRPLIEPVPVTPANRTLTSPLTVSVSETAEAWVSFDGGPARSVAVGPGQRDQVSIDVEALAGPGTHLVTLVAAEDGVFTARSVTVVVP